MLLLLRVRQIRQVQGEWAKARARQENAKVQDEFLAPGRRLQGEQEDGERARASNEAAVGPTSAIDETSWLLQKRGTRTGEGPRKRDVQGGESALERHKNVQPCKQLKIFPQVTVASRGRRLDCGKKTTRLRGTGRRNVFMSRALKGEILSRHLQSLPRHTGSKTSRGSATSWAGMRSVVRDKRAFSHATQA